MKRHFLRWLIVISVLTWTGCGSSVIPVEEEPPKPQILLEATGEVSLAELLKKPRAELAGLCEEWLARVQVQERAQREGAAPFVLVPDIRLPFMLPIWREARFAPHAGISLPPYLADGSKDSVCAMHLARYGDIEAARQLVEPGDDATSRRMESLAPPSLERGYPVEWTRLVALMLQAAEFRLAGGETEGGAELAALHRQLAKVLDAKAAGGPLGAELLARGHQTMTLAARAWRENKTTDLADQADKVLAAWGKVPAPALAVTPGAARAETARVLGGTGQGRLAAAASTLRALDLFALPFPAEGTQGVFAFFDPSERLTDVLLTYRPRTGEQYPEPGQLAQRLEDHSFTGMDAPRTSGLRSRTYQIGGLSCAVSIAAHNSSLGACVRFHDPHHSAAFPEPGRDFGAVHLEQSFEQDRVRLAPEQLGDSLQVEKPRSLALIRDPLRLAEKPKDAPPCTLAGATLQRESGHDLLARLTLRYHFEQSTLPLPEVARPLWTEYGPGRLEPEGSHLALTWEVGPTRWALLLPNAGDHSFELEARDRRGLDQLAVRAVAAAAFDQAGRKVRISAGKPLLRLPRQLAVEWAVQPVPIELGMTRDQVLQALPAGEGVLRQDMPGGLRVTFTGNPAATATHALRQLFLRWDPSGRLGEMRAWYESGPALGGFASGNWVQALLSAYRKQCGAAAEQPGSWTAVWPDLPPRKPAAVLYRWHDDATLLTFQRDAGGAELTLRDCPLEQSSGLALPALEYLPRGPEGVALGEMREGVLRRFNAGPASVRPDGSVALTPSKAGLYDGYLVWFDKDRVVRIVARHSAEGAASRPADMGRLLPQAWAREGSALGWPRRQDTVGGGLLQGLGSHDDRIRVRMFWQENNDGTARAYTEWKDLAP